MYKKHVSADTAHHVSNYSIFCYYSKHCKSSCDCICFNLDTFQIFYKGKNEHVIKLLNIICTVIKIGKDFKLKLISNYPSDKNGIDISC